MRGIKMLRSNKRRIVLPIKSAVFCANQPDQINSVQSNEKPKSKLDFGWVSLFTLSITVFTAILFGAGKAYRANYLGSFNLVDSLIPWSFQDVVYLGITKQLPILLVVPMITLWFVLGAVVFTGVLFWIKDKLLAWIIKRRICSKKSNVNSSMSFLLELLEFLFVSISSVISVGFLSIFFIANAEKLGGVDAKAEKESVAEGSADPKLRYAIIKRFVGGQEITDEGYLVSCSERVCGLYSIVNGNESSRLVPLENIKSFYLKD